MTDDNGCTNESAFIVGQPNVLQIDQLVINDASCYNGNNGSAEVYIVGGASPFTYSFNELDGTVANPNSLSEGQYIVTIIDDNGCEIAEVFDVGQPSNPIEISINSLDTEICENEMATITATGDFENYIWYEEDDGEIFGNNTNTLNVNESGMYSVVGINSEGCEAVSSIIEINVYQNPIFNINGILNVVSGNTQTYYTEDNGNDYQWMLYPTDVGTIISGENSNVVEVFWDFEGAAELFLTQTNENDCETTESVDILITWAVELTEFNENELDFTIFPNPFNDFTNIEIHNAHQLKYDFYLYDINGKLISSILNQTEKMIILKKEFSSGVYYVHIMNELGSKRKLIVVE